MRTMRVAHPSSIVHPTFRAAAKHGHSPVGVAFYRSAVAAVDVAVVGGGASGVIGAIALGPVVGPVRVFDPRPEVGRGWAYSTDRPEHILNVPAGRMSARADDADDFVTWAAGTGRGVDRGAFVERSLFGRYLTARAATHVDHLAARVIDVHPVGAGLLEVETAAGRHRATDVVLATGYGPDPGGRGLPLVESPLVVRDPYAPRAFAHLPPTGDVVVAGTGLSAVDVALALATERPTQRVIATSRRGMLPCHHAVGGRPVDIALSATTARGLLREARDAVAATGAPEEDWRSVIDGIRSHVPAVWGALSDGERARFLRHGRRAWDVHRHRLAPIVADRVAELVASGQLVVRSGRVEAVRAGGDEVVVTIGGSRPTEVRAVGLVLCTGVIAGNWTEADPLLGRLVARGLATADPCGIGPAVDASGRVVARDGSTNGLWALGPLRRAAEWEATAIPEIRRQAEELAGAVGVGRGSGR